MLARRLVQARTRPGNPNPLGRANYVGAGGLVELFLDTGPNRLVSSPLLGSSASVSTCPFPDGGLLPLFVNWSGSPSQPADHTPKLPTTVAGFAYGEYPLGASGPLSNPVFVGPRLNLENLVWANGFVLHPSGAVVSPRNIRTQTSGANIAVTRNSVSAVPSGFVVWSQTPPTGTAGAYSDTYGSSNFPTTRSAFKLVGSSLVQSDFPFDASSLFALTTGPDVVRRTYQVGESSRGQSRGGVWYAALVIRTEEISIPRLTNFVLNPASQGAMTPGKAFTVNSEVKRVNIDHYVVVAIHADHVEIHQTAYRMFSDVSYRPTVETVTWSGSAFVQSTANVAFTNPGALVDSGLIGSSSNALMDKVYTPAGFATVSGTSISFHGPDGAVLSVSNPSPSPSNLAGVCFLPNVKKVHFVGTVMHEDGRVDLLVALRRVVSGPNTTLTYWGSNDLGQTWFALLTQNFALGQDNFLYNSPGITPMLYY